ncbi:MAG: hypothetical protein ACRDRH_20505 [Pseudonocardia sp.]
MRAVALYGQDPRILRRRRVPGGWHGEGLAASYPDRTPPVPWPEAGRCWAEVDHPVVDVTGVIAPAPSTVADTSAPHAPKLPPVPPSTARRRA